MAAENFRRKFSAGRKFISQNNQSKFYMFKHYFSFLIVALSVLLFFPLVQALAVGSVIINEIMYDLQGTDTDHEWVEIKNISDQAVDLKDWRFYDGSNHLLNEPPQNGGQGSLIIAPGGYAVLADKADVFLADHPGFGGIVIDTVMSLNNTEETVQLIDQSGNSIEKINYQKEMGGNGNGYSLERTGDFSMQFCESNQLGGSPGQANNFDCNKFSFMPTPSLTAMNTPTLMMATVSPSASPETILEDTIIESEDNLLRTTPIASSPVIKVSIIINEFLPNPTGSDTDNEWIELYNNSDVKVALTDWWIEDASGQKYTFKDEEIMSQGYLTLPYSKTKITLNNNGETLSLYSPRGELAFKISYSGKANEGMSFARAGQNDWRWTSILTPNKQNQFSSESSQNTELAIQQMDESDVAENNAPSTVDADSSLKQQTVTSSISNASDKIIIVAIGLGLILSVVAAIFIKKILPPVH